MDITESQEMYLETIYLLEKSHGHAHVVDIAKRLDISKPGVTKATKKLIESGYIKKETYGSINLTPQGLSLAEKIYNYHKTITLFLKSTLGISDKEAAENACKMEHILSDTVIDAMKKYLTNHEICVLK